MPGKLRRLSGNDVAKILGTFGFAAKSQRGDHLKLYRLSNGAGQTLVIPLHRELDTGTLHSLFRQASKYVDEDQLRPHFYIEG